MIPTNIPVGISDFSEIRENGYYYVDKSALISEILKNTATKVTLITRPRRFGKTLGMSMLAAFFDIRKESSTLFAGLEIDRRRELCQNWRNQYPTVFLSFKDVDGLCFSSAYEMLSATITELYRNHLYLLDSEAVNAYDKESVRRIMEGKASVTDVKKSLALLMRVMKVHYGKPVIFLLDEYDVPVAKASDHGYYNQMLEVIKAMMSSALKDNTDLKFAVITGCLKIAKESIFTGTNHFVSDTITDSHLNEYFGFTQQDVDTILADAGAVEQRSKVKTWYDGYHFGDFDVYCPWDVMNYLLDLQKNPAAQPAGYWKNTSDNAIIRSFIDYAGPGITAKLERLLSGGSILQRIDEDLTYDYLHASEDNLWSILYLTGYLTRARDVQETLPEGMLALQIPNKEIREIFETTVQKWFRDSAKSWDRKALFSGTWEGNDTMITEEMNRLLRKTISYHNYREDFYHAFLAGVFTGAGYLVESDREHGEGRSDIVVYDMGQAQVAVFEVKYARSLEQLDTSCEEALAQIDKRMYTKEFEEEYDQIFCYGISFYKKRCLVKRKQ